MKLALLELRRRPGRFATATVILTLIAVLLAFLGGLLDGLIGSSTAPLNVQPASAIVYSAGSQDSIVRSRIDADTRAAVEGAVGAESVGGLGNIQIGGRLEGRGPRDLVSISLYGYELPPEGAPDEPPAPGEVWADATLRADDVEEGDEILLGPARTPVTVVGFLPDDVVAGSGTLWGSLETWRSVTAANRPGAVTGDDVVQALVISDRVDQASVVTDIDEATDGRTSSLTLADAMDALPGVSQQRSTFNQIIGVTALIAIVVVALFFALLTVERTGLYGVLKAVGASSGTLFGGVVVQALVVTAIASTIAVATALLADATIPVGSLPFNATPARLVSTVVILIVAALIGCAFSFRRVASIDPAEAIGGSL